MTEILEHIPIKIFPDEGNDLAEEAARQIAAEIVKNDAAHKSTVLAVDKGNSAIDVCRELIALYLQKKVDFANVIVFNLQEYFEIPRDHVYSSRKFIEENFLNHINIKPENIHLMEALMPAEAAPEYCRKYEEMIKAAGGIDIMLLEVGGRGHLAYNDPGTAFDSRTRLVKVDLYRQIDAIPDFGDFKYVPRNALTMGVGTIRDARRIFLLALGDTKSTVVANMVEGPITNTVVASYLQKHPNVTIYMDQAASTKLTRIHTPWFVGPVDWSQQVNRARAVCHLAEFLHKPILELQTRDFLQYSLQGLIKEYPSATLVTEIRQFIQSKLVNNEQLPKGKKILVFSPHPDDDIISMGGTLLKLVQNKNQVFCIYMSPGYTAVFDHEVEKFLINRVNYAKAINDAEALRKDEALFARVDKFFKEKHASKFGMIDNDEVRLIKKLIRKVEGTSACNYAGVAGYEFLDPPFYQTGKAKKNPLSEKDVDIVWDVLQRHKPEIVYAAGDLTDPNGTHRLCLRALLKAFERYTTPKPNLWLYRGAWQEFHPAEADIFVVMTPEDLQAKRDGIFRHQSQKDRPPQPGHSGKEFWQSSEERNLGTAKLITSYGFSGLFALEGLKLYKK